MKSEYPELENLQSILDTADPELAQHVRAETRDQSGSLKLIASENYCSQAVLAAMGSPLNDKYAEGVPGRYKSGLTKRFYSGCDNVDAIEELAAARARELFGAEYAYVQPHSGSDANMLAFWAVLRSRVENEYLRRVGVLPEGRNVPGAGEIEGMDRATWNGMRAELGNQRLLAMSMRSGGHLTHGTRQNVSSRMFDVYTYDVDHEGLIDYDALEAQAKEVRPLILLAGYSAYPRRIDFRRMRAIADASGAVLLADMAHFAGLVAGKQFVGDEDPVAFADVVTFTTHKTMRGPRGGTVLASPEFRPHLDRGCPMFQGGPMPHVMAAKAVCFGEALAPEFRTYAASVVTNARTLAGALTERGLRILSGGTDNHLVLVDFRGLEVTGFQAEEALRSCGLTLNRNMVPSDPRPPLVTSGLRLGTPAATTRGMGEAEMVSVAGLIADVIESLEPGEDGRSYGLPEETRRRVTEGVAELVDRFPLYPSLAATPMG